MPLKRIQQSALRSSVPDVQPPTPLPPSGVQLPLSPAPGSAEPDPLDSDDYYPYADGIPFASSPEQGRVMVDVRHALENYFEGWPGVYIGMDMLVFDKRGDRTSCLAPDVFLTFDVDKPVGRSYKIWLVGKPPDIVWEFGSVSTAKGDAGEKKERYRVWGGAGILAVRPLGRVAQAAPARLSVGGRCLQAAAGGVPQEALAVGDESAPRFGPAL